MSSLSSAPHWRSVPPDAIVWREWDGEFVVRNERSGSSHLLGPLAGRVLQIFLDAKGGLRVADIAVKLAAAWPNEFGPTAEWRNEFGPTAEWRNEFGPTAEWPNEFGPTADASDVDAAIEAVLAEFHRLGLAEPEPQ